MRVVLDTNVYISAVLVGGVCEKVLDIISRQGHVLFISSYIIEEARHVLGGKFHWTNAQTQQVERDLKSRATIIVPKIRLNVIKDNHGDNRILECAVGAVAHVLVTGDRKHLLPLGRIYGTVIISPKEFLQRV